jgi:hypothetical protein
MHECSKIIGIVEKLDVEAVDSRWDPHLSDSQGGTRMSVNMTVLQSGVAFIQHAQTPRYVQAAGPATVRFRSRSGSHFRGCPTALFDPAHTQDSSDA